MTRKGNLRQSDRDAIARYQEKTYRKFNVAFRVDEDAEIITAIDEAHDEGIATRALISAWYEASKKQSI